MQMIIYYIKLLTLNSTHCALHPRQTIINRSLGSHCWRSIKPLKSTRQWISIREGVALVRGRYTDLRSPLSGSFHRERECWVSDHCAQIVSHSNDHFESLGLFVIRVQLVVLFVNTKYAIFCI